jgi:hypothetical protein
MTVEQRLDQLEKRNKRLTVALTMTVVAMCAVVTMAATGLKDGDFDTVTARTIFVTNDAGMPVVGLSTNDGGDGIVKTHSAKGNDLVALGAAVGDQGTVTTYQANGKALVALTASDNGGVAHVYNKTGESIAQMYADEYGNGVVWAGNRKGLGQTLQPGP